MNTTEEEHKFDFTKATSDREILSSMDIVTSIPDKPKFKQLYAHEIGHLVGLVLNNIQCDSFGIPTRISFEYRDAILEYTWTDGVFRILSYQVENDFYDLKGYKINEYHKECQTTQNYINKSYDLNRFPPFISYLFLGGLFHLYWDSKINHYNIEQKHFDEIFSDNTDGDPAAINGAAGNDWTKVRMYCGEYKIPLDVILDYREKLYSICVISGFFNHFETKIEELYTLGQTEFAEEKLEVLTAEIVILIDEFLSQSNYLSSLQELQNKIKDYLQT